MFSDRLNFFEPFLYHDETGTTYLFQTVQQGIFPDNRLSIGKGLKLRRMPTLRLEQLRDGGTTTITTTGGQFTRPTLFDGSDAPAIWNGKQIKRIDASVYSITLDESEATLQLRNDSTA